MKKYTISGKTKALLFIVFLLLPWPKAYALTIDHAWVDQFSQLTDSQISQAISNRVIVRHASVGSNINNGLNNVYNLDHKYLRGNMVFQSRGNPGWQAKVDDLVTQTAAQLSKFDIFTMKYCYIDNVDPLAAVTINGAQTTMWDYYRSKMEELQAAYPTKKFVWWTMPIMTSGDANRDAFNNLVRNYANTYNIILFDVAAIESHDPQGNAITNNGREAMYAPYSSDGGHLTAAGEQRIAQAFWVLISEIAKVNTNVGDGNLALNKAPIAVSSTAAGSLASYALDGNIQTSWISAAGGTQTLGVDLGAAYPLASVVIRWGPAYATYYYVETSSNGTSWGPSYTVTAGIGLENLGITNNTRYIRIRATQGVDPAKYELVSLEVYPHVSVYNPDIQAPVISNLSSSSITSNSASISWSTNEPATSQVEYGATISYGSTTTLDTTLSVTHSVNLGNLSANTTYHYRVRSADSSGNLSIGSDNSFATAASIADWLTRAGSMNRAAFRPGDLPLDNGRLNLKWKRFFGERIEVEMEPLVAGETVYIGVMNGKLYAMDKNAGTDKWVFKAGGPLTDTPTLAYINNQLMIFFGSLDGKVYALDATTGQQAWVYQTGAAVMSTPSVYGNSVFIGSLDKNFYALDAAGGQVIWSCATSAPISTTSAIGEAVPGSGRMGVYFANGDNYAFGFEVGGTKLWEQKMEGVYTKRTMVVYGNGVVMFVTRKPGGEYSEPTVNLPAILQGTRQPGPTVISAWADYYIQYPKRRTLYYFNAATGSDLWQPLVDKTKYVPLYVPYWGEYSPLVDNKGFAWLPSSGSGGDHSLDHDIRLWKVDLSIGDCIQVADQNQFLLRFDEVGRGTLVGNRYYQTISEDIGYYDIAINTNAAVFGNGFGDHRRPMEFNELLDANGKIIPGVMIFGGMHKHFGRFGSSGPGAFGGGNDATSPLVVAGDAAFYVTWGHLYALTSQAVTVPAKDYMPLDLTTPMSSSLTKAGVRAMLNDNIQKIIGDGVHLGPGTRFWSGGGSLGGANFWREAEIIKTLSEALDYLDEPLKTDTKNYLKNETINYLLNDDYYQYRFAGLNYDLGRLEDPCPRQGIYVGWYWNNPNFICERLYSLYKYAQKTGDWQTITQNWNFIESKYNGIARNGNFPFDAQIGFFLFPDWLSGNSNNLNAQMGAMLGVREMARVSGDAAVQTEADSYLAQMTAKRSYWGKYVRSLYDTGQLARQDYNNWESWGYLQDVSPMPLEGYLDKDNDYRQVYYFNRDASGNLIARFSESRDTYPYYLVGYHPFYAEFNDLIRQNLLDEITDYINAVEIMNPWWYLGDMGHQVVVGTHEEDSMSPILASDVFQAKAYIFKESFEALRPYLPWSFENYNYKDIYRLQNLVALLEAPESGAILTGDVNSDTQVNVLDVQACVNHILGIQNLGSSADINQDGSVNVLDVQAIANIILGG